MPACFVKGFWPHLFDGLTLGAIYAMVALGYTMVYGVLQLINFAHSEVFMVGSFAGLYTLKAVGVGGPQVGGRLVGSFLLGLAASMAASAATAFLLERVAYRPLRRKGATRLSFLISAIGASLFLSNLFLVLKPVGGPGPRPYPVLFERTAVARAFGYEISNKQVLVVITMLVMYIFLDRFVMGTRTGKGIRAVAQDPETALLMGIPMDRVVVATFTVGGLMAGAAGFLYGLFFGQAQFNMGFIPGIKAFTAAVLGGIGNVRGAMLGGVLLGVFENLGVACVGTHWQDVIAFLILVGVLMFRPTGILGEQVRG